MSRSAFGGNEESGLSALPAVGRQAGKKKAAVCRVYAAFCDRGSRGVLVFPCCFFFPHPAGRAGIWLEERGTESLSAFGFLLWLSLAVRAEGKGIGSRRKKEEKGACIPCKKVYLILGIQMNSK